MYAPRWEVAVSTLDGALQELVLCVWLSCVFCCCLGRTMTCSFGICLGLSLSRCICSFFNVRESILCVYCLCDRLVLAFINFSVTSLILPCSCLPPFGIWILIPTLDNLATLVHVRPSQISQVRHNFHHKLWRTPAPSQISLTIKLFFCSAQLRLSALAAVGVPE